ncbi:MAG: hypothetical protein ABS41_05175 [Arenimonas sp. SCN 70-307]|uniref:hypothetical protein n=1 Tax=Arenimonas sp. SCN 70-307 TaxID=1660089 RepID=UPI00086F7D9C|nr:hypothetical protein [Arenimonas sp. SCN 70-307]ODS63714.1 MAG: hypothetical protein ABS41_05175 [Arenimonas sp. SCN 70-307]
MDDLTRIRQLIAESEALESARAEEIWSILLHSPEVGLRDLIKDVGMEPSQARQVLTDARIGDYSALFWIALGRKGDVREALLRMLHGHH